MNPDDGSFRILEEREPAVQVGEEFKFTRAPSDEIAERLAELEGRLGIPRDPIHYPRTTLVVPGVKESPVIAQGASLTPLQFIQGFINGFPPLKLPPLPPLPAFPASDPNPLLRERTPSPPGEKERVAIVSEEPKPQAEIMPLVYE